jgi:hypothetical protein
MCGTNLPAIETAEQPLTGRQRSQVLRERGPGPIGHADNAIACMGLRAARAHLAMCDVDVGLYARERR